MQILFIQFARRAPCNCAIFHLTRTFVKSYLTKACLLGRLFLACIVGLVVRELKCDVGLMVFECPNKNIKS